MDEDVELEGLRERVYGVDGARATPEMIARLAELEERRRAAPPSSADEVREPRGGDATTADAAGAEATHAEAGPAAGRARRALRWAVAAAGAVALVGLGIAIGANLAPPAASADPAAATYPELTFPQTVEDVISADILRDSGIDPSSTRYVATVSDFRVYLAQPDDGDGVCIATFTSSDNRPWSVGCASGSAGPSAAFGIDTALTVAVGDTDPTAVEGIPIRLSDSVTAYVAR
ncbi:hypothetical protein ACFZA2_05975 [Microbacterium sp. NPDC007973]|uniref:hypothetical protein n=1 Tax=Microbacterium sp. NPDC007973 TaxID=3364182 RepID=UPI0036E5F4A7